MNSALPATYENVRRQQLRDGIALTTRAKIDFFEEMVALAVRFGARDRLRDPGLFDAAAQEKAVR